MANLKIMAFSESKPLRNKICVKALLLFFWLGVIPSAQAYLDPGTFSFVIQTLIAALVGALFVVKSYWLSIKNWFFGKTPEHCDSHKENEPPTNQSNSDNPPEKSSD